MILIVTGMRGNDKWGLTGIPTPMQDEIKQQLARADPQLAILGDATGVDTYARRACNFLDIPHVVVPALWDVHGPKAGPMRNRLMCALAARYALDHEPIWVYAFHTQATWGRGTKNCIEQGELLGYHIRRTLITPETGNVVTTETRGARESARKRGKTPVSA